MKLIGAAIWLILGAYVCYIFAALIVGAIRDPEFRKQFLRTFDGRTNHSVPMQCVLWVMMALLYATFLFVTWTALGTIITELR